MPSKKKLIPGVGYVTEPISLEAERRKRAKAAAAAQSGKQK